MSRRWLLSLFDSVVSLSEIMPHCEIRMAAGEFAHEGSSAQATPTAERYQSLTPSPNPPQSIAGESEPSPNAVPAQSGIAPLPAPTPPANQTNYTLIRSGLLFLLKEKDRYGVWYFTQATINDRSRQSNTSCSPGSIIISKRDSTKEQINVIEQQARSDSSSVTMSCRLGDDGWQPPGSLLRALQSQRP
jgi:hypothetical protein